MDGYVKMTKEILNLVFILATWAKETYAATLPRALRNASKYGYDFLMGFGGWMGYATVALYFFA